jgi:hypothetical protein
MPDLDKSRLDELIELGDRHFRVSACFKVPPRYDSDEGKAALGRIERALRGQFWELAIALAAGLPR